jgi:hypothetical protein
MGPVHFDLFRQLGSVDSYEDKRGHCRASFSMSGQARLGREFVSYEPDEENKLTDLLQAASALRGAAPLPPCEEYFQGPQSEFGALDKTILVFKTLEAGGMLPRAYACLRRNSLENVACAFLLAWHA